MNIFLSKKNHKNCTSARDLFQVYRKKNWKTKKQMHQNLVGYESNVTAAAVANHGLMQRNYNDDWNQISACLNSLFICLFSGDSFLRVLAEASLSHSWQRRSEFLLEACSRSALETLTNISYWQNDIGSKSLFRSFAHLRQWGSIIDCQGQWRWTKPWSSVSVTQRPSSASQSSGTARSLSRHWRQSSGSL